MFIVYAGVVAFLLFAAGIIAFQNSRLVAQQEADESAGRISSLMYSVYHQSFSYNDERPEAVPLFQFSVRSLLEGQLAGGEVDKTIALCRVPAGGGEMALSDAQSWMLGNIRQSSLRGEQIQADSFTDNALSNGEKEMILRLESAVKEETADANHH
ncbi:hypothetical protein A3844_02275 [Paenibacillus helianthi]|uniref:Uncharacterized protein n=1 Tax=Paenibacillus helianthi TaxID=1349432 RepID=A0ABX3EYP4_9BACL|nr:MULTISPECIES: hypothetical protein [Paenibacillus]OKP77158.1 hypothetical protein A3842_16650 [Paenibacillus sp. P3E]OKP82651.1 hypothetical protein A3848_28955 [Paenibacillus sp. P32E]OKP91960.1 hypothetical protein A3844_02275 [Paenibacillus helianthi]